MISLRRSNSIAGSESEQAKLVERTFAFALLLWKIAAVMFLRNREFAYSSFGSMGHLELLPAVGSLWSVHAICVIFFEVRVGFVPAETARKSPRCAVFFRSLDA